MGILLSCARSEGVDSIAGRTGGESVQLVNAKIGSCNQRVPSLLESKGKASVFQSIIRAKRNRGRSNNNNGERKYR